MEVFLNSFSEAQRDAEDQTLWEQGEAYFVCTAFSAVGETKTVISENTVACGAGERVKEEQRWQQSQASWGGWGRAGQFCWEDLKLGVALVTQS